ncbi:MAG: hypothetical protein M3250_02710 [Thermoproteota archaeon]|nr:hypothetical protein [Thermoproteota archaeon]
MNDKGVITNVKKKFFVLFLSIERIRLAEHIHNGYYRNMVRGVNKHVNRGLSNHIWDFFVPDDRIIRMFDS